MTDRQTGSEGAKAKAADLTRDLTTPDQSIKRIRPTMVTSVLFDNQIEVFEFPTEPVSGAVEKPKQSRKTRAKEALRPKALRPIELHGETYRIPAQQHLVLSFLRHGPMSLPHLTELIAPGEKQDANTRGRTYAVLSGINHNPDLGGHKVRNLNPYSRQGPAIYVLGHPTLGDFKPEEPKQKPKPKSEKLKPTYQVELPYGGVITIKAKRSAQLIELLNQGVTNAKDLAKLIYGDTSDGSLGSLGALISDTNRARDITTVGLHIRNVRTVQRGQGEYRLGFNDEAKAIESVMGLSDKEAAVLATMFTFSTIANQLRKAGVSVLDESTGRKILEYLDVTKDQSKAKSKEELAKLRAGILRRAQRTITDGFRTELVGRSTKAGQILLDSIPQSDTDRQLLFGVLLENVRTTNGVTYTERRATRGPHAPYQVEVEETNGNH